MPDDDRGVLRLLIQILGQEEVPGDVHVVLVRKRDLPHGYAFALVEIAGVGGDFLSRTGAADIAPIMAAVIPSCFIARIMLSPLRFEYS